MKSYKGAEIQSVRRTLLKLRLCCRRLIQTGTVSILFRPLYLQVCDSWLPGSEEKRRTLSRA